ncbi:V-type proton ATPase subunit S1-like [Brienomyrus brachyistius]|uniref:V-type proton ATPase subunit S1-like n=1 Tax=Brienomyrus brachyistius TaxID=42636 RepID=UPI0020B434E3|nr:V-type proton ATPase subunit S1-like [Brienomyrus brachyistius]
MAEEMVGRLHSATMVFSLLLSIFTTRSCSEHVPLIMWSSEGRSLWTQDPPVAGHIVSRSQLETYLSSAFGSTPNSAPRTVLLFLQDRLSVDDVTLYGGVFGNKQDSVFPNLEAALQSSSSSLVLPSVSGSASVPEVLQELLDVAPLSVDPEQLDRLHLDVSSPALLVFRLPLGTGSDDMAAKDSLRESDRLMGNVLEAVKAQAVPYIAVYTALAPSRVTRHVNPAPQSAGRSLLQATNDVFAPLQIHDNMGNICILFWASNLTVSFLQTGQKADLTDTTFISSGVDTGGSFCNASNSQLVLKYGNILGFKTFQLTFAMSQRLYPVSARQWFTLDQVQLNYDGQKATFNGSNAITAPSEYSYHCQMVSNSEYPLLVPSTPADNAGQWILTFTDFQIQGFGVTGENFSYANDCASFFTPGIWMGLVTSLLLLLILTYGLQMIMHLRSMDRFDDPKGPAIAVPQTD